MKIKKPNKNHLKPFLTVQMLTQLAMLLAITFVLMLFESAIPPVAALPPGIKLGLSNIVVMYTLFFLGKKQAFVILALKAFFVFLTRGLFAFCMSFSGGIVSILIMILILSLKKVHISYIMTSVFASVAHNIGQLCMASIILENISVFYYTPVLLFFGTLMGVITGIVLRIILPAMKRISIEREKNN